VSKDSEKNHYGKKQKKNISFGEKSMHQMPKNKRKSIFS